MCTTQVPNKRPKKPEGAPKRAMSAFLIYSQQKRGELRELEENKGKKNVEISKQLGELWKVRSSNGSSSSSNGGGGGGGGLTTTTRRRRQAGSKGERSSVLSAPAPPHHPPI